MGQGASREIFTQACTKIQSEPLTWESEEFNSLLSQSIEEDQIIPFIKGIKENQLNNLSILVNKLVDYLYFVSVENRGKNTDANYQQLNICLNYLTRIIPFILDGSSNTESNDYSDQLFWSNNIVLNPPTATTTNTNEQSTELTPSNTVEDQEKQEEASKQQQQQPPLAIKLMSILLEMLFLPGYTVNSTLTKTIEISSSSSLPVTWTWAIGFGAEIIESTTAPTKALWLNRAAVLQCLLSCLCEQLYSSQENSYNFKSKWLDWLTSTQEYYTETLLYSLINVCCNYDPVGWGIPYNHMMFADDQENVAKLSIQIVNIVLSYDTSVNQHNQPQQSSNVPIENRFISLLKSIKRSRDFTYFFTSFERMLALPLMATHTRLPHSTKKIEIHQDILITFWRFITINHDFLQFVSSYKSSPEFIVSLLQHMDEGKKSQTTYGLVQIGTFILLVLSGERDFAISLNKNFTANYVIDIPKTQGMGYCDFIVLVMYRLLVDNNDKLESIFECILTVLSNLSPYIKNLTMVSCVKLMKLYEYLSSPRFLFANNHNFRYVQLLLETFNNLLAYQYESNTRLLYSILRCQNQFSKLAYLKIAPAQSPGKNIVISTTNNNNSNNKVEDDMEKLKISTQQNESIKDQQPPSTSVEHIDNQKELTSTTSTTTTTTKQNEQSEQNENKEVISTTATTTTTTTNSLPPNQGFIPTDEWLQSIKSTLPLDNILKVITSLSPQIQKLCTQSSSDEQNIMDYLKISTVVGLAVPGPIMIRKLDPTTKVTRSWYIAYMWCLIYLSNFSFEKTNIKLFQVKQNN